MKLKGRHRPKGGEYVSNDGTDEKMSNDEWSSPPEIANPLFDFWGLCFDPCSNDRSIIRTYKALTWGGLLLPWEEQSFANWPYSKNLVWSDKARHELTKEGSVRDLVILCMGTTSSQWWRNLMQRPKRNPRVIFTPRLSFLGPDGKPVYPCRFEPALIYYGARHRAFDNAFRHVTRWSTWGRSTRE